MCLQKLLFKLIYISRIQYHINTRLRMKIIRFMNTTSPTMRVLTGMMKIRYGRHICHLMECCVISP